MRNGPSRILGSTLVCFFWFSAAVAGDPSKPLGYPDTPEGVVRAYVETIYNLTHVAASPTGILNRTSQYTSFDDRRADIEDFVINSDWVTAALVTNYGIGKSTVFGERYRVDVTYEVIGYYKKAETPEGGQIFTGFGSLTYPITETIPFVVERVEGRWRIAYPISPMPRISAMVQMKEYQQDVERATKEGSRHKEYYITQLRKLESHLKQLGLVGR
jgi:hypothetical protein